MDPKLRMETASLILLLIAFPIISLGATRGSAVIWIIGLACVLVGGLLPIWTRFMDHSRDEPTDMGLEYDERAS